MNKLFKITEYRTYPHEKVLFSFAKRGLTPETLLGYATAGIRLSLSLL